jgi:DNA-binding NarL/FixJ family response regulator
MLSDAPGFECAGAFGSGEAALERIPQLRSQVVLMDINLPKMSGVECTRQLKELRPDLQIIMLTVYDDSERIFLALQMGASGYLLKRSTTDEILEAIKIVRAGGAPMSNYIARKVVQSFQRRGPSGNPAQNLSKREAEILAYLAQGCSNKKVAEALGLSTETIRAYLRNIYTKLQVHSRSEAIVKWRK